MDYLTDLLADVEERINDIQTIGDINKDLMKIAVRNLEVIRDDLIATGKNQGILKKVERQLTSYHQVSDIATINEKLPIIHEQMVVLMIGALEVYIADIFREISNNNPEYLTWKNEKEKVAFEPTLLSEGFTLGDVIIGHLKNKGYSFQDLRSILEAFETYFDINVSIERQMQDVLIVAAATRNVIVHNRSEIDASFLKQIRETRAGKESRYKKGHRLGVNEKYVNSLGVTIKEFCQNVTILLMQRDQE